MTFFLFYTGTLYTQNCPKGFLDQDWPEFYRLDALNYCNEITVCVKASQNAQVMLYHGSPADDSKSKPVVVTLGGDNNTTCSIGIHQETTLKARVDLAHQLTATMFKSFTIEWNRGRISVYNEGFTEPFLWWQSPEPILVDTFGIRTQGSSAEWQVQGYH